MDPRTVVRAGYGLFWAPWNYNTSQHGQIGFARSTGFSQSNPSSEVPINVLDNPFPGGLVTPIGSSSGLLTGVGGQVDFVDQNKGNPHVHQYSADIERELPGSMAITIGYVGASGRDIGYCGTNDCSININQIDPAVARAAFPPAAAAGIRPSCSNQVPNPFFGIANAGEFGTRPTIQRGQLLRPFPEFGDVLMHESTAGSKRQYNAVDASTQQAPRRQAELVGRALQLHLQPDDGQPVRREQRVSDPNGDAAEQLRPGELNTASATSIRRTTSSWRRSS